MMKRLISFSKISFIWRGLNVMQLHVLVKEVPIFCIPSAEISSSSKEKFSKKEVFWRSGKRLWAVALTLLPLCNQLIFQRGGLLRSPLIISV